MTFEAFSRRAFLLNSTRVATAGLAATAGCSVLWASEGNEIPLPKPANTVESTLDAYITKYMQAMNAPGMTLGLTDAHATLRSAGYGYAEIDLKLPVNTEHRFQIGSITKSFVAMVLLQLHEEGKVDFWQPILNYLPWLPISEEYGPITVHHLMTHSSGLPDNTPIFQSNPTARLIQGFKPGEHFYYCNTGYGILGLLVRKLDGRSWRESVTARILEPLEMHSTYGVISTATRALSATGYWPYWDDQVYARQGKLTPGPNLIMDDTAGCVQSTPGDMARYMRMFLNRGLGDKKRIISEESFKTFSTPFMNAEDDFGPGVSYGYGIAISTMDGHKILRHTGGMESFASSITVDLDGGVAAFASINAMQGYRPVPVTEYAVKLLRASHEGKTLPENPVLGDPLEVKNASEYAGSYTNSKGEKLSFAAEGNGLLLIRGDERIPLQKEKDDLFISTKAGVMTDYEIQFGRKKVDVPAKQIPAAGATTEKAAADTQQQPKPPVIEVSYGPDWFINEKYTGPLTFALPEDYSAFVGRYAENSLFSYDSARVYVLKGELYAGGLQLKRMGGNLFRAASDDWNPELIEFFEVHDGMARAMKAYGSDFVRVEVD